MLKKLFKKEKADKILKSIADGYVDIKMYNYDENNNKVLVYHDSGDNTVTEWMRTAIIALLAGVDDYKNNIEYDPANNAYIYNSTNDNNAYPKHPTLLVEEGSVKRKTFPTKILFGTGREYTDWDILKEENSQINPKWYNDIVEMYGAGSETQAKSTFTKIKDGVEYNNEYSATYGSNGTYSGDGKRLKAVTVEDPDTHPLQDSVVNMSSRFGVVGAVKTIYTNNGQGDYLNPSISTTGRLLKSDLRGIGYPCFIYFDNATIETVETATNDKFISGDASSYRDLKNRITFTIHMPAQNDAQYYPYNGVAVKQVGLFNDTCFSDNSNMKEGTMLAVKNITPFTKFAGSELNITWTLTV